MMIYRRRASEISSKEQEYIEYLWREEGRLPSAKKLGLKECQRCGLCCLGATCIPLPDEIEPIAEFLGLTSMELVRKYMVIDKSVDTNYFLRFAKEGQGDITGTCLTEERRFDHGYCILLDREAKACKIYPARPEEARDWNCWDIRPNDSESAWGRDDIYRFIPGLQPSG